jgi:hypothetical protein
MTQNEAIERCVERLCAQANCATYAEKNLYPFEAKVIIRQALAYILADAERMDYIEESQVGTIRCRTVWGKEHDTIEWDVFDVDGRPLAEGLPSARKAIDQARKA